MMVKFNTAPGGYSAAEKKFYIGYPQHVRTMSKKEAYRTIASESGYKSANIRAVWLAFRDYLKENAANGNVTYADGVAMIRIIPKGGFDGLNGPWVKGVNYLQLTAIERDPFKSTLAGIIPENSTEGANPLIKTVFDETTKEYDVITGTDVFSIAGADLGPDAEQDDEYVALVASDGTEVKAEIDYSDIQNVKAHLSASLEAGTYTLTVYTRSGMGKEFGVKKATRKVEVK